MMLITLLHFYFIYIIYDLICWYLFKVLVVRLLLFFRVFIHGSLHSEYFTITGGKLSDLWRYMKKPFYCVYGYLLFFFAVLCFRENHPHRQTDQEQTKVSDFTPTDLRWTCCWVLGALRTPTMSMATVARKKQHTALTNAFPPPGNRAKLIYVLFLQYDVTRWSLPTSPARHRRTPGSWCHTSAGTPWLLCSKL